MASRHVGEPRPSGAKGLPAASQRSRLARTLGRALSRQVYLVVSLIAVLAATLANVLVSSARPMVPGANEAQAISWSIGPDMPAPREYYALAASNDRVFAVGGLSASGWEARIDVYTPATNSWTFFTNLPEARIAHGAAVVNNKLYVFGGMIPGNDQTPSTRMLDLTTMQWYIMGNMQTGRRDFGVAVDGNYIYAVGGTYNGIDPSRISNFEAFDTNQGVWFGLSPMLTARRYVAAGAYNGKVYAIGGIDDQSDNKVEVWTRAYNSWTPLPDLPLGTGRFGLNAATVNGRVYPIGGFNTVNLPVTWVGELDSATNVYDPFVNQIQDTRGYHGVTTIGNTIYVAGGGDSSGGYGNFRPRLEIGVVSGAPPNPGTPTVTPSGGARSFNWSQGADMPVPRNYIAVAASADRVYAIGGLSDSPNNGGFESRIDEYNPATNSWTQRPSMTSARIAHQAAIVGDKLYVIGGWKANDSTYSQSVEMLNLTSNQWSTLNPMPTGRRDFAVAVLGNWIYALGGNQYLGSDVLANAEAFDTNTNTWYTLPSMPTGRRLLAAGTVPGPNPSNPADAGKLYAFGGVNNGSDNVVEMYDLNLHAWATLPATVPGGRFSFGVVRMSGALYDFDGYNGGSNTTNWVDQFDPVSNLFSDMNDAPIYRVDHGVAAIGNTAYVVGGWTTNPDQSGGVRTGRLDIATLSVPGNPTVTPTSTPRICPTAPPNPYPFLTPVGNNRQYVPISQQQSCTR